MAKKKKKRTAQNTQTAAAPTAATAAVTTVQRPQIPTQSASLIKSLRDILLFAVLGALPLGITLVTIRFILTSFANGQRNVGIALIVGLVVLAVGGLTLFLRPRKA